MGLSINGSETRFAEAIQETAMTPAQRKPSYNELERLTAAAKTERSIFVRALVSSAGVALWSRLAEPLRDTQQPRLSDRGSPHRFG